MSLERYGVFFLTRSGYRFIDSDTPTPAVANDGDQQYGDVVWPRFPRNLQEQGSARLTRAGIVPDCPRLLIFPYSHSRKIARNAFYLNASVYFPGVYGRICANCDLVLILEGCGTQPFPLANIGYFRMFAVGT